MVTFTKHELVGLEEVLNRMLDAVSLDVPKDSRPHRLTAWEVRLLFRAGLYVKESVVCMD